MVLWDWHLILLAATGNNLPRKISGDLLATWGERLRRSIWALGSHDLEPSLDCPTRLHVLNYKNVSIDWGRSQWERTAVQGQLVVLIYEAYVLGKLVLPLTKWAFTMLCFPTMHFQSLLGHCPSLELNCCLTLIPWWAYWRLRLCKPWFIGMKLFFLVQKD
jgi:hypothetical protein